jgi:hypothetical protein
MLALLIAGSGGAVSARAAESLHKQIDALIAAKAGGPVAAQATDAEFLRRVYLDLVGTIPIAEETRKFLEDSSPDKRANLIDTLQASPDYSRRMAEAFDVMLMERRTKHDSFFSRYLQASFAANKPWDQLAREILCPDADNAETKASALWYYQRLTKVGQNPIDYPLVTRDVGRLFMGIDLKCCQCHNHKYIKDYKQVDFQGLFAIVGQTFIRADVKGFPTIGEKPLSKKVEFVSVFHPDQPYSVGPRIPFGTEIPIPPAADKDWIKPPDPKKKFPGIPRFSGLKILAEQTCRADNDQFKKNIANRLWFLMMGRGLINPLDLSHSENPPTHPELLTLLADHIAATGFDMKDLIRELALTQTYQRSSVLPDNSESAIPPESYRVAIAKRVAPEQMARAMLVATGQSNTAQKGKGEKPGFVAKDMNADVNEEELGGPKAIDPVPIGVLMEKFVNAFGAPKGEAEIEFAPSVAGALFLSNEKLILGWLQPASGGLVQKLSQMNDPGALADELYLSTLTRLPSAEERSDVAQFLTSHSSDRAIAISEMTWGLIASTEFCINH